MQVLDSIEYAQCTMSATVLNQRRHIRWSVEADGACELVLLAQVLASNDSSSLSAGLLAVLPDLTDEVLNDLTQHVSGQREQG